MPHRLSPSRACRRESRIRSGPFELGRMVSTFDDRSKVFARKSRDV
jgi:hypothetical protein